MNTDTFVIEESALNTVRIWSIGLHKWWKPDGLGYTTDIEAAGVFTCESALEKSRAEMRTATPNHVLVPLAWREMEPLNRTTKVIIV